MSLPELLVLALALSFDAAAVALARSCRGAVSLKEALLISAAFGAFQAGMPALGAFAGARLSHWVRAFDHWIAFGVLGALGVKMLYDAVAGKEDEDVPEGLGLTVLLALSVATSIDALAVGVTFPMLGVHVPTAIALIGVVTFALSFAASRLGGWLGARFGRWLAAAGGLVLVLLGTKVLVDYLRQGILRGGVGEASCAHHSPGRLTLPR